MLHLDEWPFRQDDLRQGMHRQDAPVASRHDIALAHYLERQRAYRLMAMPIMDPREDVRRLLALATRILSMLPAGVPKEHLRGR